MKIPFFNKKRRPRRATAALDSTSTPPQIAEYYAAARNEPATETFDRSTREISQARAEMEFLNDTLLFGVCQKVAALVVGPGPALKIDGPTLPYGIDAAPDVGAKAQYLEKCFRRFGESVDLLEKIRLIAFESIYHGEVFLRKISTRTNVEGFDYAFVRPERVCDPAFNGFDPLVQDGVVYDVEDADVATPVGYYVRREKVNPYFDKSALEYDFVPASEMIHLFSRVLPGQRRGVPECQTALGIIREIKQLRHFEIQACKNSSKLSVIFHTNNDALLRGADELEGVRPGASTPLPDGIYTARPGYTPTFGDAKHPATGFDSFKKLLGADVGSALGVGAGKANNDHSPYNFSSAKMDEQIDAVVAKVRQRKIANDFLDVLFNDWLLEFSVRDTVAAETLETAGCPENIARRWLFPEPRSLDREKEAKADEIELRIGTITLEQIAGRRGWDYEELRDVRARELKDQADALKNSGLGLSTTGAVSTAAPPATESETEPTNEESEIE